MKTIVLFTLLITSSLFYSQTTKDLFKSGDTRISWLGVDYSHVKLVGNFSQFAEAGEKSADEIKDTYFPAWNLLVINEASKYDLKGMLRKKEIFYDIDMIMALNDNADLSNASAYNPPHYTPEQIKGFVDAYQFDKKEGIGIVFIAECLSKSGEEAFYHFVAINLSTNEILLQERLRGEPRGFGLRNYWAGSVYDVIKKIKQNKYNSWKRKAK